MALAPFVYQYFKSRYSLVKLAEVGIAAPSLSPSLHHLAGWLTHPLPPLLPFPCLVHTAQVYLHELIHVMRSKYKRILRVQMFARFCGIFQPAYSQRHFEVRQTTPPTPGPPRIAATPQLIPPVCVCHVALSISRSCPRPAQICMEAYHAIKRHLATRRQGQIELENGSVLVLFSAACDALKDVFKSQPTTIVAGYLKRLEKLVARHNPRRVDLDETLQVRPRGAAMMKSFCDLAAALTRSSHTFLPSLSTRAALPRPRSERQSGKHRAAARDLPPRRRLRHR